MSSTRARSNDAAPLDVALDHGEFMEILQWLIESTSVLHAPNAPPTDDALPAPTYHCEIIGFHVGHVRLPADQAPIFTHVNEVVKDHFEHQAANRVTTGKRDALLAVNIHYPVRDLIFTIWVYDGKPKVFTTNPSHDRLPLQLRAHDGLKAMLPRGSSTGPGGRRFLRHPGDVQPDGGSKALLAVFSVEPLHAVQWYNMADFPMIATIIKRELLYHAPGRVGDHQGSGDRAGAVLQYFGQAASRRRTKAFIDAHKDLRAGAAALNASGTTGAGTEQSTATFVVDSLRHGVTGASLSSQAGTWIDTATALAHDHPVECAHPDECAHPIDAVPSTGRLLRLNYKATASVLSCPMQTDEEATAMAVNACRAEAEESGALLGDHLGGGSSSEAGPSEHPPKRQRSTQEDGAGSDDAVAPGLGGGGDVSIGAKTGQALIDQCLVAMTHRFVSGKGLESVQAVIKHHLGKFAKEQLVKGSGARCRAIDAAAALATEEEVCTHHLSSLTSNPCSWVVPPPRIHHRYTDWMATNCGRSCCRLASWNR